MGIIAVKMYKLIWDLLKIIWVVSIVSLTLVIKNCYIILADLFHRPNMLNFVIQCIIKVKDMQYSDLKKCVQFLKSAIQHNFNFGQN